MGSFVPVLYLGPARDYLTSEWSIISHDVLALKDPIKVVHLVHLSGNGHVVLHFSASILDPKTTLN